MNRRQLLQAGSVLGLSMLLPRRGEADDRYTGPVLLHFHAGGGWDPTLFCDAKLKSTDAAAPLDQDSYGAVVDINGIKVPSGGVGRFNIGGEYAFTGEGFLTTPAIESPERFFRSPAGQKFLVFNGVDTRTNSHETGTQFQGGGHMSQELPALAALVGARAALDKQIPMTFLAGGPYNLTGDVIAASRFDRDRLANIAFPHRADPNNAMSGFLPQKVQERLAVNRTNRIEALNVQSGLLSRSKKAIAIQREAMLGTSGLSLIAEVFQAANLPFDQIQSILPYQDDASLNFMRQGDRWVNFTRPIESLLRCFASGVSASATYSIGRGFDTHDNHDANQSSSIAWQLLALRYTMMRAETLGLSNRLHVLVTSDFGRTPMYNNNNKGKDHWNVTSVLVAGPGIRGGRAIGASDAGHKPKRVAADNVTRVVEDQDTSGVRIRPSHVHRELRRVFDIDGKEFAKKFPLPGGDGEQPLALLA